MIWSTGHSYEVCLLTLDFPSQFVNWLMACVSTVAFSISLNGQLHGFFPAMKELRQSDPLSAYVFVICLEYLSRQLGELHHNRQCVMHFPSPISPLPMTLLFFQRQTWDRSSLFSMSFGSSLSTPGWGRAWPRPLFMLQVLRHLQFQTLQESLVFDMAHSPLLYLGIPLAASRLTLRHFKPFLDKVGNYIGGWIKKTLSYAGRLQGVECFWLSIFPIPASWQAVCTPKDERGLGLFNLTIWNKPLLFRTIWNIHMDK
ncbi:hypothetical protein Dimus_038007 [Dionaea muscipula]